MKNYAGNTALVTGAGRRLGRHIALTLAENGMNIIAHYLSSEKEVEETAKLIRDKGVHGWSIQADLGDPAALSRMTRSCGEIAGEVSVLVNSASIFRHGGILDSSEDEFIDNLRINALAPLELCRWFSKQCSSGSIVNILDARMDHYHQDHIPYALSKQALGNITRILCLELAPRIRVNGVAPGLILPPEGQGKEYLEKYAETNPLQTWGAEEDISEAVLYLLGARFVTGQLLYVDGGRHLRGDTYEL